VSVFLFTPVLLRQRGLDLLVAGGVAAKTFEQTGPITAPVLFDRRDGHIGVCAALSAVIAIWQAVDDIMKSRR
jgi:hypothetical protein